MQDTSVVGRVSKDRASRSAPTATRCHLAASFHISSRIINSSGALTHFGLYFEDISEFRAGAAMNISTADHCDVARLNMAVATVNSHSTAVRSRAECRGIKRGAIFEKVCWPCGNARLLLC